MPAQRKLWPGYPGNFEKESDADAVLQPTSVHRFNARIKEGWPLTQDPIQTRFAVPLRGKCRVQGPIVVGAWKKAAIRFRAATGFAASLNSVSNNEMVPSAMTLDVDGL